jgi:hypothetical protein
MKIRIRGNSIRLRLTQTEIDLFSKTGLVSDTLDFGDGKKLIYTLEKTDAPELSASFENNTIRTFFPGNRVFEWTKTDMVGLDNSQEKKPLYILVEKDFQCLKPRSGEDDTDAFPNPTSIDMVD